MAEEITQRLGFDASSAIESLRKLQEQLNKFKQSLQSTSGALRKFPSKATPAIQALKQLSIEANKASTSMQGLAQSGTVPAKVSSSAKTAADSMSNLGQQAQNAGQKVQTVATDSFNKSSQAANNLSAATNKSAQATQQAAKTTVAAANQTGKAMQSAGEKGTKAAKGITLSWQTMIRVVKTQVLIRALSQLVSAFFEAQTAAADFSISVGEISTISTGALGSLDQISDSVLELSRSLGLAADEVAEGLYQTLSNQVVEAGDALRFEEQAAKLSIATHSQLKESINALSSIINSYGLDVTETERVSDVLFKTIELGRLRMGEFGDVLGRVTPLTATLGIRYEEMAAAIAALTQKGVPAHTAITQLTQVSQKLLRPTEKLQELYHEWGVETGPEAIRRFGGLQGVLLKMKDATSGNDKEFADLLGRVRAMVGALNLTSNEGNALTEALDAMANSAGASDGAFQTMEETIGRRAVKAWNDLKVSVLDAGESLLEITTPVIEAVNFLVKNFEYVAATFTGVAAAALLMSGKIALLAVSSVPALTGAVAALKVALLSLWPIALAVGVALATIFIVKTINEWSAATADFTAQHTKDLEDIAKTHEDVSKRMSEATRKEFAERRKVTGDYFTFLTKEYRKTFEQFEVSSKAIGTVLDDTLSNISSKKQKVLAEIREAVHNTDSVIKESAKEVADTQAAISDTSFKRDLRRMNSRQQLWAKVDRAQAAAVKTAEAYGKAGASEEGAKQARELSHIAEKRAQEALAHAEESGNYSAIKQAEKALDKVRADRLRAEITFQETRKQLQTDAHKAQLLQIDEYEARVTEIAKKLQGLLDPIADGKLKGPTQLAEDMARAKEVMQDLKGTLENAFDVDMYESLGVADTMAKLQAGVEEAFSKAQIDYSESIATFRAQLGGETFDANVKINIENQELIDRYVEKFGEISPDIDPGKFQSRIEQLAEEVATEYEQISREVDTLTDKTVAYADQAADIIKNNEFKEMWAGASDATKQTFNEVKEGYFGAGRRSAERRREIESELTAYQDLTAQVISVGEGLKQAAFAGRELTQTETTSVNNIAKLAKATLLSGEISNKEFNLFAGAWTKLLEGAGSQAEVFDLMKERTEGIGDGTYAASLRIAEGQEQAAEAQAKLTEEGTKTEAAVEGASEAAAELPNAAAAGTTALKAETDQATQLKLELQGAVKAQKELNQTQSQATGPSTTPATEVTAPTSAEQTGAALEAAAQNANQLTHGITIADQAVKTVNVDLARLPQVMGNASAATSQMAGNFTSTTDASGRLLINLTNTSQQVQASSAAMSTLNTATGNVKTSTDNASTSTANLTTNLNSATTAGYALARAMQAAAEAAAQAARAAAAASSSSSAGGAYYGGPAIRYRQAGGFAPRGKDTIPVMASPDEFFVNARNARRFSSELQAMNAGSQPIYRDHGGPVTNVGDINVSVTQGEAANQTARQIATALRRELRRGTSRLD